jgi:hypothetical protein
MMTALLYMRNVGLFHPEVRGQTSGQMKQAQI